MIKKITRHGNSQAVLLDRAILELLKIDSTTPLEVTTNGKDIILSPIREDQEKLFQQALEDGNRRYKKALKKMANS
jgi:antitoxin component of MazEF toxin-antitoxin module